MDYSILLIVVIYLVTVVLVAALTRKYGYAFPLIPGAIPAGISIYLIKKVRINP
jgi:hypothetical protein